MARYSLYLLVYTIVISQCLSRRKKLNKLDENELFKFRADCLKRHNIYRSVHRSNRIHLSDELNEQAQKLSEELASTELDKLPETNFDFGVNILITEDDINGETPVDIWYSENVKYDYEDPTPNNMKQTGAFTQLVWSRSRRLGVGTVKTLSGKQYVVCLYSPPGNIAGKFIDNIKNPIDLVSTEGANNLIHLQANELETFRQSCLNRHNIYRSIHRSRRIHLNNRLNEEAQKITELLARSRSNKLRVQKKNYGINIFITEDEINGETPVDIWYSEQKDYKYDRATPDNEVDQFTQLVWNLSTQLGVGTVKTARGEQYVVCLYNPAGNIYGRFKDNVRNPIDLLDN